MVDFTLESKCIPLIQATLALTHTYIIPANTFTSLFFIICIIYTQIHLYHGGPECGYEYLNKFVYVDLHVSKQMFLLIQSWGDITDLTQILVLYTLVMIFVCLYCRLGTELTLQVCGNCNYTCTR
jgi:hypothetical protein